MYRRIPKKFLIAWMLLLITVLAGCSADTGNAGREAEADTAVLGIGSAPSSPYHYSRPPLPEPSLFPTGKTRATTIRTTQEADSDENGGRPTTAGRQTTARTTAPPYTEPTYVPPPDPPKQEKGPVPEATRGIVTFISDDWSANDWDYREVFVDRDVPCTIAAVVNNITDDEQSTSRYCLITLQNTYGYEVASHTVSHQNLLTLSSDDQRREILDSRRQLAGLGFDCFNICIPFGKYDESVLAIARSVYRAVRVSDSGVMQAPYTFDHLTTSWIDVDSYDEICHAVDAAWQNNGWCILSFHSNGYDTLEAFEAQVGRCIDYAQSKEGMLLLTLNDALDSLGAAAVPEF